MGLLNDLDRMNRGYLTALMIRDYQRREEPHRQARVAAKAEQKAAAKEAKSAAHEEFLRQPTETIRRRHMLIWAIAGAVALFIAVASPAAIPLSVGLLIGVAVKHHRNWERIREREAVAAAARDAAEHADAVAHLTDDDREWLSRNTPER